MYSDQAPCSVCGSEVRLRPTADAGPGGYRGPMPTSVPTSVGDPPSAAASLMYGVGLGGFVDGIVLHQILQWHHMVSATGDHPVTTVAGLEVNTLADGFFHLATWMVVMGASVVTLAQWRQGRLPPSWRLHVGGLLAGWGGFNVVEGLVDHQLLGVHHVRDDLGGPLAWDLGFLAFGAVLVAVGWVVVRAGSRSLDDRGWVPTPVAGAGAGRRP